MTRNAVEIDSSEVQLPEWLRDRESQLNGFVHPGTADGLMKAPQSKWTQHLPHGISLITASEACHKQLHGMLSNQALEKEAKMMKMYYTQFASQALQKETQQLNAPRRDAMRLLFGRETIKLLC